MKQRKQIMHSSILLGLQTTNRQRKTHSGQPLWSMDSWLISARTPRRHFDYGTFWQVGRFNLCPLGRFDRWDVLTWSWDVLTMGRFDRWDVLTVKLGIVVVLLSHACFLSMSTSTRSYAEPVEIYGIYITNQCWWQSDRRRRRYK